MSQKQTTFLLKEKIVSEAQHTGWFNLVSPPRDIAPKGAILTVETTESQGLSFSFSNGYECEGYFTDLGRLIANGIIEQILK